MITYNDLYEASRKEKYSEQLQKLPKKFVADVASYVVEKKKLTSSGGDEGVFSEEIMKSKKQAENALSIFNEMMLLRKKKILGLVFVASETGIGKSDSESFLDFEKELFDSLMESVKKAEKSLASQFSNGNGIESVQDKLSLVLFLENVGEFVGMDGSSLGPYTSGEIANISRDVAEILKSDRKVEFVSED